MQRNSTCLFCKIIAREIPATIVKESDTFLAIADINPQAPVHLLIIPKHHYADITKAESAPELGRLFHEAVTIAQEKDLQAGFRLVVNTGKESGQTVFHLHIHLLAGRAMHWPPG